MVLLLAVAPAASLASTANVNPGAFAVQYHAGPGESNELSPSVTAQSGLFYTMRFDDPGATIAPGSGCQAAGPHAVTCRFEGPSTHGLVDLGDGDDTARVPTADGMGMDYWAVGGGTGADHLAAVPAGAAPLFGGVVFDGASGNDVLTGSAAGDRINGGSGDDILDGGAGPDMLDGGGGRDQLRGGGQPFDILADGDREGAVDSDVLDGGGRGALDYSKRTRPVHVDLTDPGRDGESGEGDVVRGFREVDAGSGKDTLAGTNGNDTLSGGRGADRIEGRSGRDHLFATAGDFVDAGRGNDSIDVGPLAAATAVCGPGTDSVVGDPEQGASSAGPLVSRTCERLSTVSEDLPYTRFRPPRPVAASHRGRLVFRLLCPGGSRRCRLRLDLTRAARPFRLLARRHLRITHGRRRVAFRLPRRVVRRARKQSVRLRFHFVGRDSDFAPVQVNWRFDLRLR